MPVADFDARIHATLSELGVDLNIKEEPFGVPTPRPQNRTGLTPSRREMIGRSGRCYDHAAGVKQPPCRGP